MSYCYWWGKCKKKVDLDEFELDPEGEVFEEE